MDHLYDLEKERGVEGKVKFVVSYNEKDDSWFVCLARLTRRRVRAINVSPQSFAVRQKLLPACLGMRDEELSKASGIDGCVFVHISGFMGINKTKEGALKMAFASLYPCLLATIQRTVLCFH